MDADQSSLLFDPWRGIWALVLALSLALFSRSGTLETVPELLGSVALGFGVSYLVFTVMRLVSSRIWNRPSGEQ
ncbi:hypothetical protein OB955_06415 [Halobacteria archaeon AArc-m2/3/4]|uniref:Uncharacterized protein n=1 Tax=Natronoglomus mannanivorans TaxID=2979990 RepID=A0AAP3E198_9EURY|nr:hypothetical protein [Halobacteria archaeon AArc-xg1-1]MCU4972369.1 hypothetical protein [Halobacteria archaeon AArc-m2/3/4]